MWQRVQTILLGLVALIMLIGIFLPLWRYVDQAGVRHELFPLHFSIINGEERTTSYIPYSVTAIFMIGAATLAVMTIRRYDNRILQIKMAAMNMLLLMVALIAAVYFSYRLDGEYNFYGIVRPSLWMMFGAVACNWSAMRFIRRDEKLVRDSDRLR